MNEPTVNDNFVERIGKFLEEFMSQTYPVKDNANARESFRQIFQSLVPKYFCVYEKDNEGRNN